LLRSLEQMIAGERITQIVEGNRRFDLVVRLPESDRDPQALANLLIETPTGFVPLRQVADVSVTDGPNQVSRENARRRIVLSANTDGRDMAQVIADIRATLAAKPMPEGYFTALEGQFQAQEQATRLIAVLATLSLAMIFMVLYSRYKSAVLTLVIMGNIPLALVGSVVALWISGQPLSVAAWWVHHADRHCHAQRHPEDQPLHQPVRLERRALWPAHDRARLARAPDARADDRAGGRVCAAAADVVSRRPGQRNAAPRGRGDLWRPDQLHPAGHPADPADVLAVGPGPAGKSVGSSEHGRQLRATQHHPCFLTWRTR
jgi:hypothetical protein